MFPDPNDFDMDLIFRKVSAKKTQRQQMAREEAALIDELLERIAEVLVRDTCPKLDRVMIGSPRGRYHRTYRINAHGSFADAVKAT